MIRDESPEQIRENTRLSTCQGKTKLMASVANKLMIKHNKAGRSTSAYKCKFCAGWHIGTKSMKMEPYR